MPLNAERKGAGQFLSSGLEKVPSYCSLYIIRKEGAAIPPHSLWICPSSYIFSMSLTQLLNAYDKIH